MHTTTSKETCASGDALRLPGCELSHGSRAILVGDHVDSVKRCEALVVQNARRLARPARQIEQLRVRAARGTSRAVRACVGATTLDGDKALVLVDTSATSAKLRPCGRSVVRRRSVGQPVQPRARAARCARPLILPTLNESITEPISRLSGITSLTSIAEGKFEILVVDDSPDDARGLDVVEGGWPRTARSCTSSTGLAPGRGGGIRTGDGSTTGSVIFIIDCDLPVPLEHVAGFLKLVEDGADAVVGGAPGRNAGRPLRHALSAQWVCRRCSAPSSSTRHAGDTQCAQGVSHQSAAPSRQSRGMFDLEYLYVAARWRPRDPSQGERGGQRGGARVQNQCPQVPAPGPLRCPAHQGARPHPRL